MDLKLLIEEIQRIRLNDSDAALKNIANSEKYLQQAYEGRYLFELIQNVRDANKENKSFGSVYIELKDNLLVVSNTGSPFSKKGINSITTIGDSPKDSKEFIGFKGIGFKSVFEISESPTVITEWGSIEFSRNKTKTLINSRDIKINEIPLFFIPHYNNSRLSIEEINLGIVTRIHLPIKPQINIESIKNSFEAIGIHQLLLLGCLSKIEFAQKNVISKYEIIENDRTGKVTIQKNNETYNFKHLKPQKSIFIPQSILEQLDDKEKEIYAKEPFVDISLVFDLDKQNRFIENNNSKLYLFFPTEITSGFNFIIHSYFIVNPERKALRNSPLNIFILENIADYLSFEWLKLVKRNKNNFINFLVFERNKEAPILCHLYNRLIQNLTNLHFLYDKLTDKFYKPNEVILADGFDKGLFVNNQLNGKNLLYINNEKIRDWLNSEFQIQYLTYETIADNIEKECLRQKKNRNISYFENLYQYLVKHSDLNLKGRKILLTSNMKLLSNEDDVFYGSKEKINLPESIQKKIHFIHPKVKISEQRQGKSQTGFLEYSTELLVRRLLKLYNDKTIPEFDILSTLLKLNTSERLNNEIKQKILLPVKSKIKWLNPFYNPIYIENNELNLIYKEEKFIDVLLLDEIGISRELLEEKLMQFGAWKVPAIYFEDIKINVTRNDNRFIYLTEFTGYSTLNFQITGDWKLDIPKSLNSWFTQSIINNWDKYLKVIQDENNHSIKYNSQSSNQYPLNKAQWIHVSSFLKYLKENKWIILDDNSEPLFVKDVIGIDEIESLQTHSFLFKKFLKVLPIQYNYNNNFISTLELLHLDSRDILTFQKILTNIYNRYRLKLNIDREFISFYNKILSKLFDLFNYPMFNKSDIVKLGINSFLGINEVENKTEWKTANKIYYIEDKTSYEILPIEIKKIIQPHFTNRDKNRFGQIAKRIGLDFKKVISQKVIDIVVLKEISFCEWFPSLAECLSLIELFLETNLDEKFVEIKKSKVILCSHFSINLFKDGKLISTLSDQPYNIQAENELTIYVKDKLSTKKHIIYANILNDILVEILGKDLSRIRVQLIDFIEQNDKVLYLQKYDVTYERIDEIKLNLNTMSITKIQIFWMTILSIKSISNQSSYILNDSINLNSISSILEISFNQLSQISKGINYDSINAISNIESIFSLFTLLSISLEEYNNKSDLKIDFRQFYLNQIEGIKQKFKPQFINKLQQYLSKLDTSEQAKFQNTIDLYSAEPLHIFEKYVLKENVDSIFISTFKLKYPNLQISINEISEKPVVNYLQRYRKNEREFKKQISLVNEFEKTIDDFLSINLNRSLLYFDGTLKKLIEDFKSYSEKNKTLKAELKDGFIDLSQYINDENLEIKNLIPTSIDDKQTNQNESKYNSKGKRIDGSKQNINNDLIGIVAEKSVYDSLLKRYPNTEWVSKNAAKAGINPEGSDAVRCDITYVDDLNQVQYVEVKGKIDANNNFYISYPEYTKALEAKQNYHIIIVKNTLDNNKREILNIGNIFYLEENLDVFNNKSFTANFNTLEITYK